MTFIKRAKPVIYQVGSVTRIGTVTTISGWGLTYCLQHCGCHVALPPHTLVLQQDNTRGELGLEKFRACYCCEPWSYVELSGFLRDLAQIGDLIETTEQPR